MEDLEGNFEINRIRRTRENLSFWRNFYLIFQANMASSDASGTGTRGEIAQWICAKPRSTPQRNWGAGVWVGIQRRKSSNSQSCQRSVFREVPADEAGRELSRSQIHLSPIEEVPPFDSRLTALASNASGG